MVLKHNVFPKSILHFVKKNILLILILTTGILARTYHFPDIPRGLYQDEAATGYEAYALSEYGIDRNGDHYPVHLIGYGSGQVALSTYLSIPFIKIFGLNIFSTRLLNLVLGIITLVIFYIFTKEISDKKTALLSTFLLAINPWHIMISRWGFDPSPFPALFLIGTFFLILYQKRTFYLPLAFIAFALSLYSYLAAYFIVPIFLFASGIYLLMHKKVKCKLFFISIILFFIIALPIILFLTINILKLDAIETPFLTIPRLTGPPRFETQFLLFGTNQITKILGNLKNIIRLLVTQDDGWLQHNIPHYGFLYLFSLPFTLIGLFECIRSLQLKKFQNVFFILAWFVSAALFLLFVPAEIHKWGIIFLPMIFFTAAGIMQIKTKLSVSLIILLYLISFPLFMNAYFRSGPTFFESLGDAINFAAANTDKSICVTLQVSMPYIFVLFYQKIDPHIFVETVVNASPGTEFQWIHSFDRYYFGLDYCKDKDISAFVFENSAAQQFSPEEYSIKTFNGYSVAIRK